MTDINREQSGSASTGERLGEALESEGRGLAGEARRRAEEAAADRKNEAASYVGGVASAVESMSRTLEDRGYGNTAHYTTLAADQLKRIGESFSAKDLGEIVVDLERFARERPALFFGGALLAGFGLGRFLKASGGGRSPSHVRREDPSMSARGMPAHQDHVVQG